MNNMYESTYIEGDEEISQGITTAIKNKTGKRMYFTSNNQQTLIRNAITGVEYTFYTGSKEQNLLFKCVDTTGRCDSRGFKLKPTISNSSPNHLFFDSPEQCMRYLHVTFSPELIQKWHNSQPDQKIE